MSGYKVENLFKLNDDNLINHPSHYGGDTTYEPIKVIEAWNLGFHLGNTVKYIAREGKKGCSIQDLKKALWYLQREIDNREKYLVDNETLKPKQVSQEAFEQLIGEITKHGNSIQTERGN